MTRVAATDGVREHVERALAMRHEANERFFAAEAGRLATLCHRAAERFARGGRLLAIGCSPSARSDVRHVAVEFVHPVIVGKRALPALGLGDPAELRLLADPDDIVIVFGDEPGLEEAVAHARSLGCLTIAFSELGSEWELVPGSRDPFVDQELAETAYHVLWELVHVFFEHRGLLEGRDEGPRHDTGASSFLYPFLAEGEHDLDAVLADVRASVLMKADEVDALRAQTLGEGVDALRETAAALRSAGKVLALGNGGSATDATDFVADLAAPPPGRGLAARRALDLTADPAILTALANDIGTEAIFSRQVIAYGAPGDALVAFSTSGNSPNVIAALAEARNRGLVTVAFVGYDGGRVAAEELADHVVVTRSQHIPRIQEAQASGYHVLRELIELE
jgi:D-sedoheptulose 7-phosphate isomerase